MPFLAGYVTPYDFGATGNGITDDTSALQQAINYVNTQGGGTVLLPEGNFAVTPVSSTSAALTFNNGTTGYSGIKIMGVSTGGAQITKLANGPIFAIAGPATDTTGNTHAKYINIENVLLNGNSLTGTMIQCYYADNIAFSNVHIISNYDVVLDTAEFWDSRFYNVVVEASGSLTNSASTPNFLLRNSAAASGFGFSTDSVNQIYFDGCRWESFRQGAVWIQQGVSNTSNPLGIFFVNSKMESSALRGGPHFSVDSSSRGIYVNHLYCYSGGFGGTFNTAQDVIAWSPNGFSTLENVVIANRASTTTVANGVTITSPSASTAVTVKNIHGLYLTAPTGAHVNYGTQTGGSIVEGCYTLAGTLYSNAPSTALLDQFVDNNTTGTVAISNTGTVAGAGNSDLQIIEGAAAGRAFGLKVTGDTEQRYFLNAKGDASYGGGTSVDFTFLRNTTGVLAASKSLEIGSSTDLGDGGVGVLKMANATTAPGSTPTGGAVLYASSGNLFYKNSSGFIVDLSENATTSTTTATTVTGVTAITSLAAGSTVAANTLAAGQVYKVKAWGVFTCTTAQNIRFDLMWGGVGGTSLINWGTYTPTANQTGSSWAVDYDFVANSTTQITTQGELYMAFFLSTMTQQTTTVTSTSSELLTLAVTPSATGVSITCNGFYFMRTH